MQLEVAGEKEKAREDTRMRGGLAYGEAKNADKRSDSGEHRKTGRNVPECNYRGEGRTGKSDQSC